jgi:hypothetical protein
MATRMQQRRGTAQQWLDAAPVVLAAGEIGFEIDSNQFKIGDGVTEWANLSYFKNLEDLGGSLDDYILLTEKGVPGGVATLDIAGNVAIGQLSHIIDGAPENMNTLKEISDILDLHNAHVIATEDIHGIADTTLLARLADITDHNNDTSVHGIADTTLLVTQSDMSGAIEYAVDTHSSDTTSVHGIVDTAALATKTYADGVATTAQGNAVSIAEAYADDKDADVIALANAYSDDSQTDAESFATSAITNHNADTTDVHGISNTANLVTLAGAETLSNKTILEPAIEFAQAGAAIGWTGTTKEIRIPDYAGATVSLETTVGAQSKADGAVAAHDSDTTNVHGIADTAELATKTYADNAASTAVAAVIDAAPAALDTLNELAAALGDNANFATTVTDSIATKAPIANPTFTGTVAGITKSMVGLGSVDNTSDANKPVSTATQTELDLKAPLASPTFTGTVSGVTKSHVGLGNVDNTSDANKPVSTATQTALDLKAPKANPTFTGTTTAADVTITGNLTVSGTTTTVDSQNLAVTDSLIYLAKNQYSADTLDIGIYGAYGNSGTNGGNHPHTGLVRDASDGKWKLISGGAEPTSNEVDFTTATKDGLVIGALDATSATIGNVSNTELQYLDGVTSAIQTQIDAKAPIANPTFTGTVAGITKSMVGLGNVDNTSDASKPISTATQTALDAKAPLASPALTGTPTAPTASAGTNTTQVATTAFVGTAVANLVASAPSTLDTLNELATALGNDASFSTTVTTNLGLKAPKADPTFTGTVTVSSSGVAFTDGTQTKEGVPSRTPIVQKTAGYTLSALTERDSLIEVSSATAVTVTIPANSAVAYPVGTSIDILQTSTGQVTIAAGAGVTVNATPGLKLRTQWSGATLFKRATDTWVVYGDLSA